MGDGRQTREKGGAVVFTAPHQVLSVLLGRGSTPKRAGTKGYSRTSAAKVVGVLLFLGY